MATNADEDAKSDKKDEEVKEDNEETKDADASDETSEDSQGDDGQTDDDTDEGESKEAPQTFTKGEGFDWVKGETPEEAFENLKTAYQNSTAEALKWKRKAEGKDTTTKQSSKEEAAIDSPILRQAERRELEAMNKEYDGFLGRYPSAHEPGNAEKLEKRVQSISKAIQEDENREPAFTEVLGLAAASLGWKEDTSGKVAAAMKDAASSSTKSSSPKATSKSKVTPAQIKAAKKFMPGKSDAEIAKELEPYAV